MPVDLNLVGRDFMQEALTTDIDSVRDKVYPSGVKGFIASGSEVCYDNVSIDSGSVLRIDGVFICSNVSILGEVKLNGTLEVGGI
ncbi:hypothetical protein [Thermococcus sp.]